MNDHFFSVIICLLQSNSSLCQIQCSRHKPILRGTPSRVEALCIQMYPSKMQHVTRSPGCTTLRTAVCFLVCVIMYFLSKCTPQVIVMSSRGSRLSEHNRQMSRHELSICLPTMLDSISREHKGWYIRNHGCCISNWSFTAGRIEEKPDAESVLNDP